MTPSITPLHAKIERLIIQDGPIPLADYMHLCMADPQHGYYKTKEAIGKRGDFITAPEVSQMFGELIGIWCIDAWTKLGKPSSFCLAELGPGNGTLMHDLLRAVATLPEFGQSVHLKMVESSPVLREKQAQTCKETFNQLASVSWVDSIDELPDLPTIIIANEFFDVIPFRQYIKQKDKWLEVGVGIADDQSLGLMTLPNLLNTERLPKDHIDQPDGTVFETAPAREAIVEVLANHINKNSGASLIIDYGHLKSGFGDTFQAMKNHQFTNPLERPGECDLTSHVDFEALSKTIAPLDGLQYTMTKQGDFLLDLGLLQRAGALGAGKDAEIQNNITQQVERLAAPKQMGDLFKVLAMASFRTNLLGFPK